jgi:hypothetical protein
MRKTLDRLISWTGLILAGVLLVVGGLMTYAAGFVNSNVEEQLVQQEITMPVAAALQTQEQKDALLPYAGQKMTTGDQAKAFADHYILEHMNASSDGRTYSQVSGEYQKLIKDPNADPAAVKELGDLRQSLFMGSTLRGMLLNAYAFGTMAKVAAVASVIAYVGAGLFLILGLLGLRHAKYARDAAFADAGKVPANQV